MTKPLEAHIAELQEVIDGPHGKLWYHTPAVSALIAALEQSQALAQQQGNIAVELFDEVTRLRRDSGGALELRECLDEAKKRIEELEFTCFSSNPASWVDEPVGDDEWSKGGRAMRNAISTMFAMKYSAAGGTIQGAK